MKLTDRELTACSTWWRGPSATALAACQAASSLWAACFVKGARLTSCRTWLLCDTKMKIWVFPNVKL